MKNYCFYFESCRQAIKGECKGYRESCKRYHKGEAIRDERASLTGEGRFCIYNQLTGEYIHKSIMEIMTFCKLYDALGFMAYRRLNTEIYVVEKFVY